MIACIHLTANGMHAFAERGNSGAGRTHPLCAIGHAFIETGRRVFYTRTTVPVQRLQAALAKRDKYDLIILDDIGYLT